VLGGALVAAAVWAGLAFVVGKHSEAGGRFLKNYRPPSDYEAHLEYPMRYAIDSSEPNEVVFVGDSTCLSGIEPVAFQELTGLRAYSLASVGVIGFDGYAVIFRHYLAHHPRPRALVLCCHPWALGVPPTEAGPADVRRRFLSAFDSRAPADEPAGLDGIAYYVRQGFWAGYGALTGGAAAHADVEIPHRGGLTLRSLGEQVRRERGYWEHPGTLPIGPSPPPKRLPVSSEAAAGTEELARLAAAQGIRFMVRLTPRVDDGLPEPAPEIDYWLAQLDRRHPAIAIGRPAVLSYPQDAFGQQLHMNRAGANRWTATVAREVFQALEGRTLALH
jgi:hypothetical protein